MWGLNTLTFFLIFPIKNHMAKEIVSVLKVNTVDSEKTIKGLREEIKSLKTQLESAEIGSEQFTEASKALAEAQNELKSAMTATKATVENADGSYNALVQTMSELKKEWRATADEVRRNQLGQQIDNINSRLKDMDASVGNYQRNVGNYAESFGEAMKEMRDSTEQSRAKLESVQKIASGLASGYAAVQGAMALFGVENEKLAKTFVRLQAAIAIAQGIGGMKDLIEGMGTAKIAFKGAEAGATSFIGTMGTMKTAIVGTGIGALVVGLGMLIQYFMSLEDEIEDSRTALEKLNDEIEKTNRQTKWGNAKEDTKIIREYIQAVQDAGNDVNKLREAESNYEKALQANTIADAERAYENAKRTEQEAKDKYYSEKVKTNSPIDYKDKLTEEQLEELFKKVLELETATADAERAMFEARAKNIQNGTKQVIEAAKQAYEQRKAEKEAADNLTEEIRLGLMNDKERELEILRIKNEKEKVILKGRKEDLLKLEELYRDERQAIIDKYDKEELEKAIQKIETEQEYKEREIELKYDAKNAYDAVEELQNEIDKLGELRQVRLEAHYERLAQIDELLSNELISYQMRMELEEEKTKLIRDNAIIEIEYLNAVAAARNKQNSEEAQAEADEQKRKEQQRLAVITGTKTMLSNVSKLMKEDSKEQKSIATAIATIDTYQSANAAYKAMAGIPVVGPALAAAAAAAAIAAGFANVKAIWAVDESGSNTSSLSSASVIPTFNAEQAMPVEYTRNVMTDSEMETINQPTKVVVLESDISEVQNRVQVRESNATF